MATIIIILCTVLVGSIIFSQYSQIPKDGLQTQGIPTQETAPSDETTNWKTYINKDYGYELKYPPDWIIEIDNIYPYGISLFPKGFKENKRDIMLRIDPINVGRDSVFESTAHSELVAGSFEDTIFAGKEAKQYICGPPCLPNKYFSKAIHIVDIEKINWGQYNEIAYNVRTETYKYLIPTFEKILSTFRFLQ